MFGLKLNSNPTSSYFSIKVIKDLKGFKQWFLIVTIVLMIAGSSGVLSYELKLSNNGPVIQYSNLSIYAELVGGDELETYTYVLQEHGNEIATASSGENYTFIVNMEPRIFRPGTHELMVKVYKVILLYIKELIATAQTRVDVTSTLNGKINVSELVNDRFVAVNSTINVTYELYDPSSFFKDAKIEFVWEIGPKMIFGNPVSFNVTDEGILSAHATIHASVDLPSGPETFWGFQERKIQALRRVSNINITGNIYLPKGDVVAIDINCDGSSPFKYCWVIFTPDATAAEIQNITCEPVTYSQCSFHFQHYFHLAGKYSVGTWIGNNLGLTKRVINIEIYDVSTKSQLSTIIVPISCSLLGMLIIVAGVTYHIHQRRAYVIEVADFDFHQPVQLCEKTFMERVKESFKIAIDNCKTSTQSLIEEEDEGLDNEDFESHNGSTSNSNTKLIINNYRSIA